MIHNGKEIFVRYHKDCNGRNTVMLFEKLTGLPYMAPFLEMDIELQWNEVAVNSNGPNDGILATLVAGDIISEPHSFIDIGTELIPVCKIINRKLDAYCFGSSEG